MDNLTEYLETQNKLNGIILKMLLEIRAEQIAFSTVFLASLSEQKGTPEDNAELKIFGKLRKDTYRGLLDNLYAKHSDLPDALKGLLNP